MTRIAAEPRNRRYKVSEPTQGKKSFGITSMKCEIGIVAIGIAVWPPGDGDLWQLRAGRLLSKAEPLCEPTPSELIALEDVRDTAMAVIAEVHGNHDLRWLSSQECIK